VRGKGLFCGIELVADRESREPVSEAIVQSVVGDCMAQSAVMIGAANRSLEGMNNTLFLSPALICTKGDVEEIVAAVDGALSRVSAG